MSFFFKKKPTTINIQIKNHNINNHTHIYNNNADQNREWSMNNDFDPDMGGNSDPTMIGDSDCDMNKNLEPNLVLVRVPHN